MKPLQKPHISVIALAFTLTLSGSSCKKNNDNNCHNPEPKSAYVETIAGSGNRGLVNDKVLSAEFNEPNAVEIGPDGALYVADYQNSCIRKIADGQVTTFAGSTIYMIKDGSPSIAGFQHPTHISLAPDGSFIVLDNQDPRIRRISRSGYVNTYIGSSSTTGDHTGDTASAMLNTSGGRVAFNNAGDMFIADSYNNVIRKVTKGGQVTTFAGSGAGYKDGPAQQAMFNNPRCLTIDPLGNIFVADLLNRRIRKITLDGQVSTFSGSGIQGLADGKADKAQFNFISDIVSDKKGALYISDQFAVRKISANGEVSTVAGAATEGYKDGDLDAALFSFIFGIGIDNEDNIYVADTFNHRIRKISFK